MKAIFPKLMLVDVDSQRSLVNILESNGKVILNQIKNGDIISCNNVGGIVVGTGNKVEDYGVGFYTKYGDGGVDIALCDLYKTEVRELGRELGVIPEIINATPTDGLWEDGRNDEDQIGASYEQLEEAMETGEELVGALQKFNAQNKHKMDPIPTYKLEV